MISIIMPTYNRFEIAKETIEKIASLSTNILFELIVVNDGEELPFVIKQPTISIYKNPKKGASSARNYCASKAKYDFLFFIDDDMWITAESLAAIDSLTQSDFFKTNCALLNWQYPESLILQMQEQKIGRYLLNANYHTLEGRLQQTVNKNEPLMQIASIGSGSFVIHKMLFEQVGKYDDAILFQGEDIDLSNKLNAQKIGIFLYTRTTCFHNQKDRLDIDGFLDRDKRGFESQFKNMQLNNKTVLVNPIKKFIFTLLMPFFSLIKFLFKVLPNIKSIDKITFRLIGTLSSITYFKALKNAR